MNATTTELVLLGTAGGRTWGGGSARHGISSAVVVDGSVYLVDCGEGWGRRYREAGLGPRSDFAGLEHLQAVFITHLHADHVVDYPNLFLFGLNDGLTRRARRLRVIGPGPRGALPPTSPWAKAEPAVVDPLDPTPGIEAFTDKLLRAFATDVNDSMRDGLKPDPRTLLEVTDITLPLIEGVDPQTNPAPPMAPFVIYEDQLVRVSATLVHHAPMFPCFGFRFDTDGGSIVFSGDTNANDNLIRLAAGADCLVHEVIDRRWAEGIFPAPRTPAENAKLEHLIRAHTTIEEIGRIGRECRVGTVVLSHFGPASNPSDRWLDAKSNYSGDLIVGEDLMRLRIVPGRGAVRVEGSAED